MFGKLITASDGKTCTVETDPHGWTGTSDLHISVLVPTRSLEIMREGSGPQIDLQLNPENGSVAALGGIRNMDIYSAPLFDKSKVKLVEALPGFSAPRPILLQSPNYEWSLYDDTATPSLFSILDMTFTSRLTFRQECNRVLLASGTPVTVDASTPCSVSIRCRPFLYQFLFPYPVIARRANIKVNRKAGWIEITVPLASDKEGGYIANRFPVLRQPDQVCNWNLPTVSFDILTKIDNTDNDVSKWVIPHLDTMFSRREYQLLKLLKADPQVDVPAFTLFKKSICDILCTVSRIPESIVHCIQADLDDQERIYITTWGMYLNDTTHSVVAEAYVMPYVHSLGLPNRFEEYVGHTTTIVVGKEAFKIWKQALPAMVESCRDWDHRIDCTMVTNNFPLRMGTEEGESSVCLCCALDDKPKGTPIALFPIFGVPYLEELRDRTGVGSFAGEIEELEISDNGQNDSGIQIGGNVLCKCCQKVATKRCAKCNVKYCSKECQRQDWKQHKTACAGNEK
jgi:MYND finger